MVHFVTRMYYYYYYYYYLSGILFFATQTHQPYGPFCGELGIHILMEKGLTFGSHTVFMLIYSFAESIYRQTSFGINMKGEFCAGFTNPCNFFISLGMDSRRVPFDRIFDINITDNQFNGFQYYNCIDTRNPRANTDPITLQVVPRTVGIEVDNTKADTCYHIQYFPTALQDKECLLEYSGLSRDNVMNVTVSTYSEHSQAERCHNCSGMVLRTYPLLYKPEKCKRELYVRSKTYHEVSTIHTQSLDIGSTNHFLFWFIPIKTFNRTIKGEFHVMIHSQRNCSTINLGNLPKLNMSLFAFMQATKAVLTNNCSVTSINMKRNTLFTLYSLLPSSHIDFNIVFENPAVCNNNNHSLVLLLMSYSFERNINTNAFIWVVQEGKIKWRIQSSNLNYVVFVVIHQIHNSEITTFFHSNNGAHSYEVLFRDIECTDQLRVHIHHHTSSVEMNLAYEGNPAMQEKYCVSSVCYYMYRKSHNTWTSAVDTCNKQKQQLLTINSDFESNLLNDITHEYRLLDSPVLFLNLRRDSKVCIYLVIGSYRHHMRLM